MVGFVLYKAFLGVFFSYSNGSSPVMAAAIKWQSGYFFFSIPIGAPLDDPVLWPENPAADQGAAHRLFPSAGLACFGRHFLQRPLWGV